MTNPTSTARQASRNLTSALVRVASQGLRTPCSDVALKDWWTSEHEQERKQAALWCIEWDCPVITECLAAAVANDERACVWGGHDFYQRPGKRLQPGSEAAA
jgi:hypothetical protein